MQEDGLDRGRIIARVQLATMTNESPGSTKIKSSKSESSSRMNFVLLSVFCAFLAGVIRWAADSDSPMESLNPDPAKSYYNLLVQGFQSGQLNMKMDTPPEMAKLADPYDYRTHNWTTGFWTNKADTSFYKGKFYLYFGVTPPLVLFWPYAALTGDYLSDRYAVAIFFGFGFLMTWWLLCDIRRRYFPETSFGAFAPGILILGLALCLVQSGLVHEVARNSGFCFVMLALAGIWQALHRPGQRNGWLLLASLFYGLAVGSRPSLLFGAIILLIPALQAGFETPGTVSRHQIAMSFLSAVVPITLIGTGLMVYNDLRFDSPFEFGIRYQLTGYDALTAKLFSLHYFWFNIRYYFLEPMSANAHFPFLQQVLPHPPPGYAEYPEYGGILFNYPLILLFFATPLVWRKSGGISGLRWFALALLLLFATCVLTDCFFIAAQPCYEIDFLPSLILLAFIGFAGLDRRYARAPGRRRMVVGGWYVLLGYSLVFNLFSNVTTLARSYNGAGCYMLDQQRPADALEYLQNAVLFDARPAMYHNQLAVAYAKTGDTANAMAELKKALAIDPNCTKAQYNFGALLYQGGQSEEAFGYFEKALTGDPNQTNNYYATDNANNAWLLVSNPDASKRNEALALKLAGAACRETRYKVAETLIISAAVYGETGRTNEAMSLAQKAIADAKENGESNLLDTAKSLLAKYQKNERLIPPGQGDNPVHSP